PGPDAGRAREDRGARGAGRERSGHRQVERAAGALEQAGHHSARRDARVGRAPGPRRGAASAPAGRPVTSVATRVRHFLSINDLSPAEVTALLDDADALKRDPVPRDPPLRGRALAMIFEKPSLRTRLSFDVAMRDLGGHSSYLSPQEVGLGRRESVSDVARVVSRYVDVVVLRTFAHETLDEFAKYSTVPVINGLSDLSHPCQGLADIFTIRERKGPLAGVV